MANSNVTGLDDWLKYLDDSPRKMEMSVHIGLEAGAQLIEATARANCPVGPPGSENVRLYGCYPGALRDSIRITMVAKKGRVVASIRAGGKTANADVYYAHLIEFSGAKPHIIRAAPGKSLNFGGRSYKSVHHPGMQPPPFLRPALDANELAAIGLLDQQIDLALQK